MLAAATPAARAQSFINFTITGSITNSDPDQQGRLLRNGVASQAGTNKPFPGILNNDTTTLYNFDEYVFTNEKPFAVPVFITLSTTVNNPDLLPFSEAYLTFFNPTNIAANYRGDSGGSPQNEAVTYSITVPANTGFDVIVNETAAGGGVANYTLTVVSVPEPSTTLAMVLGAGLLSVAVARRARPRESAAA